MPGGGRKKPFSGKQKRAQLQAKKTRQQQNPSSLRREEEDENVEEAKIITKPGPSVSSEGGAGGGAGAGAMSGSKFFEAKESRMNPGKYSLMFRSETKEEAQKSRKNARKPIRPVEEEYLECKSEDFYTPELDFPTRPPWNYEIRKEDLERNENRYFQEYLKGIDHLYKPSELSYFELNLETWRQLWRVLEMSDILLCVVDIRFPTLLFPPRLYEYVCKELGKHVIVVLNKIDLCPAPLVLAWRDYFMKTYEGLQVLYFTSFPEYNLHGNLNSKGLGKTARVRGKTRMAAEGAMEVYKACEAYVQNQVDLTKWKQKILEEMKTHDLEDDSENEVAVESVETLQKQDTSFYDFKKFSSGILSIGCVGQPNVGKSSLINALMGRKVVSVSRTPGHTKHFQTIFLTSNVRLIDCPGLIFPSKVPKPLQVLCGSYPIAQLREPYSTVKYLAERLDLPKILAIQHPEDKDETVWTAFDIADGWALKRSYYTAKASRLDSYRGANHILRLALAGRICLCLRPPGYTTRKDEYHKDSRLPGVLSIQAKSKPTMNLQDAPLELAESEDSEAEEPNDNGSGEELTNDQEAASDIQSDDNEPSIINEKAKPKGKTTVPNKFAMLGMLDDDNSSSTDEEN